MVVFFLNLFSEFEKLFNMNMLYCLSLETVMFKKEGLLFPGLHTTIFPPLFCINSFFLFKCPILTSSCSNLSMGWKECRGLGVLYRLPTQKDSRPKSDATLSSLPLRVWLSLVQEDQGFNLHHVATVTTRPLGFCSEASGPSLPFPPQMWYGADHSVKAQVQ